MKTQTNRGSRLVSAVAVCALALGAYADGGAPEGFRKLYLSDYVDKMEGAWIGQSMGVAYGWPSEFCAKGDILPPDWQWRRKPDEINETFNQDDLYVEMTFLSTLCKYGIDVSPAWAGVEFAKSRYRLWCANAAGRNNVRRYICPPDSSHPSNSGCPNYIDYQIESDFSGIISPGLPRRVNKLAQVFGRIMNYGDGLWAGEFVGAMYAEAFFETNRVKIVEAGLKAIPAESQYAEVIRDVLAWYREALAKSPKTGADEVWQVAWHRLYDKWIREKGDFHGDGKPSPLRHVTDGQLDARINGAMVVIGFLWGEGDFLRTMQIAMRCGYDSDCNPSTAAGVLGTILGKGGIPRAFYEKLDQTRQWEFTDYNFWKLSWDSQQLARKIVVAEGGRIEKDAKGEYFLIPNQTAVPDKYEPSWAPGPKVGAQFSDQQKFEILKANALEETMRPVRPIGVNGQEGWNRNARFFTYPPTFAFAAVTNAVKYRFEVIDDRHVQAQFEDKSPNASLAPVWNQLARGFVSVRVTALDKDGKDLARVGERRFWKKAAFVPGGYEKAKCSYADAARRIYDYVFACKQVQHLLKTGEIDRTYTLNCYPAKMHAAIIRAMVHYAKMRPDRTNDAIRVARRAADWMIAHTAKPGEPLAGFPITYDFHEEVANSFPGNTARGNAGISMNIYPANMARAYLLLYGATGEGKYLKAAVAIGERFLALQGEDGTWYLKQRFSDGRPANDNRLVPIESATPMMEELFAVTKDAKWRAAGDRSFASVEKGPLATWNWEGQFEDTPPTAKFENLTKHGACSTAIYMIDRFRGDWKRRQQSREILRFAEDQFVFWERPYAPGNRTPPGGADAGWFDPNAMQWRCPAALEQYKCYQPIDASAAKLIRTYLALYSVEKDPLDLAKARVLGDRMTQELLPSGLLPTFWCTVKEDWINCMVSSAEALEQLAAVKEK